MNCDAVSWKSTTKKYAICLGLQQQTTTIGDCEFANIPNSEPTSKVGLFNWDLINHSEIILVEESVQMNLQRMSTNSSRPNTQKEWIYI